MHQHGVCSGAAASETAESSEGCSKERAARQTGSHGGGMFADGAASEHCQDGVVSRDCPFLLCDNRAGSRRYVAGQTERLSDTVWRVRHPCCSGTAATGASTPQRERVRAPGREAGERAIAERGRWQLGGGVDRYEAGATKGLGRW